MNFAAISSVLIILSWNELVFAEYLTVNERVLECLLKELDVECVKVFGREALDGLMSRRGPAPGDDTPDDDLMDSAGLVSGLLDFFRDAGLKGSLVKMFKSRFNKGKSALWFLIPVLFGVKVIVLGLGFIKMIAVKALAVANMSLFISGIMILTKFYGAEMMKVYKKYMEKYLFPNAPVEVKQYDVENEPDLSGYGYLPMNYQDQFQSKYIPHTYSTIISDDKTEIKDLEKELAWAALNKTLMDWPKTNDKNLKNGWVNRGSNLRTL